MFAEFLRGLLSRLVGLLDQLRGLAGRTLRLTAAGRLPALLPQRRLAILDQRRDRLRVAGWALEGALAQIGDDPEPSMENVAAVMAAKREVALAGLEVCDLALDVAGGQAFYKTSPNEQCYRDIRGVKFHPFGLEETLIHAGEVALGLPADKH